MKTRILTFLMVLLSPLVMANDSLEISQPFAKETPPTSTTSAIFLTITNRSSQMDYLVSAQTPVAGVTELHTHAMYDGVMKMRKIDHIEVVANGETVLKPHSLHIMLFDIKEPLKAGMEIPLTLNFKSGQEITLSVPVKSMKMKM
jgi:copper(I)-binding protein